MGKHYKQHRVKIRILEEIIDLINITCFCSFSYIFVPPVWKERSSSWLFITLPLKVCTKIITLMSANDMLFTDMPTKVNKASVGRWIRNSSLICQQLLWWLISFSFFLNKKFQHWVNVSLSLWVLHKNRPLNLDCTPPSLEPAH